MGSAEAGGRPAGGGCDRLVRGPHLPGGPGRSGEREAPVAVCMVADAEAGAGDQPRELRKPLDVPPHHEEGGRHVLALEQAHDPLGGEGVRSVVEGEIERAVARPPTHHRSEHGAVGRERAMGHERRATRGGAEQRRQHHRSTRW